MKNTLLTLLIFMSILGCKDNNSSEIEILKTENELLKKEIDNLKNGPSTILTKANNYIKEDNLLHAEIALNNLINNFPESEEAINAKDILQDISDKLRKEKEKTNKDKAARLSNATNKMRKKLDDIKEITWYTDKSTPIYANRNNIHLYFGKMTENTPFLRLKIQYTASDWLFIKYYTIKTDNNTHNIYTTYGDVKKDNDGGEIWEWYDVPVDNLLYEIIKDIISSKNVKLRYNGDNYYKDRTITNSEIQALKNVLDAYEALGGNTNFN